MADLESIFDASVEICPPVKDGDLAAIPAKRGVVMLSAAGGQPILVLTAADMRSRVQTRLGEPADDARGKKIDLREITRKVHYSRCASHFETDLRYLRTVVKIFPHRYEQMVAWQAPWFVSLDVKSRVPRFSRRRGISASDATERYFGPFAAGRDADRFIDSLADAFRLCRDVNCLRDAPNHGGCTYAEMNRCVGVGVGRMSMEDYRLLLETAGDFAAGRRDGLREKITADMQAHVKALEFEQAGVCKRRLERLSDFDLPAYRYVRDVKDLEFLLVHRGMSAGEYRFFSVVPGEVAEPFVLEKPATPEKVQKILAYHDEHRRNASPCCGVEADLTMGLVTRYLFCEPAKAGLVVPGPITQDAASVITEFVNRSLKGDGPQAEQDENNS
ncbi:MAG TPA: hypothetical protein PKK48_08670 [Phycisphaerae bacterium]|nr:hypothetical protein [Phycisphaerae bacterium]HPS53491.1 hypothetical protein [Phycisphaerae bacterium]